MKYENCSTLTGHNFFSKGKPTFWHMQNGLNQTVKSTLSIMKKKIV